MLRHIKASVCVLLGSTLIFGVAYPFITWGIAHLFFPWQAEGSPLHSGMQTVGLRNIGQRFTSPAYLWGRPSAVPDTMIVTSGGSNLSWSSPRLRLDVEKRSRLLHHSFLPTHPLPSDLIMASASGYDPDISMAAAQFQLPRISAVRNVSIEELEPFLASHEELSLQGLFPSRVNVLLFNLALDKRFPIPPAEGLRGP